MADGIRRSHARVPCDRAVVLFLGATTGRSVGKGRLLDLSLSGAYLDFEGELQRGTPYRLRVSGPDEAIEVPFRVVREGPRGGGPQVSGSRRYGLIFNLTADQERLLRRLLDVLRREPLPGKESTLERSLRNYWSS